MEEPEKACHKQEKQKRKMVINIGKCGGVGGIIFLAGVLATAAVASAAVTLKRRHQKTPTKHTNKNHQIPSDKMEDSKNVEATKGLHILVPGFPPGEHHQLSSDTKRKAVSKTGLTCLMTAEKLIMDDEKIASGIDEIKEGSISIGEDVLIECYSSSNGDYKIKKGEIPFTPTKNLLHSESAVMNKPAAEIDIKVIKHHHKNEATLPDQHKKTDNPDNEQDSEREQVEEDQNYKAETSDSKPEVVEIASEVCRLQKIQLDEQEQETLTGVAREKITIECSIKESITVDGKELLSRPYDKLSNEVSGSDERFDVAKRDRIKDDTDIAQVEIADKHDNEILKEKCDRTGETKQIDDVAIVGNEVENTIFDQSLQQSRWGMDSDIEEQNCLGDFPPANFTYTTMKQNQQPSYRVEVTEEYVAEEPLSCKEIVESNPTMQLIENQQRDGEENEVADADTIMTEDDSMVEMSDESGNTKDIESNEEEDYDNYMNIAMAEDDLIASDEEKIGGENELYDDHYDDNDEEDACQINSDETFEASSPDTVDSSLGCSAEAIWPIETLSWEDVELNKVKETAEESQNIDCKCVGSSSTIANGNKESNRNGKPKLVLAEKCMMGFAAQYDPVLKSIKWRILIGIIAVLLWLLCSQYFGLPFEKLSLQRI